MQAGIDTLTAEAMVAFQCDISLPREEGGQLIGLLDECGASGARHQQLFCLYGEEGEHSPLVAVGLDGTPIFGRWENFNQSLLPALDACGAHFGQTPTSNGLAVYHHHLQALAPVRRPPLHPPTISSCVLLQ